MPLNEKDPIWLLSEDDRAAVVTEARHLWFRLRQDDPRITFDECLETYRHVGLFTAELRRMGLAEIARGIRMRIHGPEVARRLFPTRVPPTPGTGPMNAEE